MMAEGILVIGESGAGKSTSIEHLNPQETFIINIANKSLPFKGWRKKYTPWNPQTNPSGNIYATANPKIIEDCMVHISTNRPEIKVLILEDFQYMSSFEFFDKVNEKGYDKFTRIGADLAKIARKPKDLREDLTVFYLTHVEDSIDFEGRRKLKAKTIGKMVDEKLTLEGLFTIVLFARVKKDPNGTIRHVFETVSNGDNTCKSPKGMFSEKEIENNLKIVVDAIEAYQLGV